MPASETERQGQNHRCAASGRVRLRPPPLLLLPTRTGHCPRLLCHPHLPPPPACSSAGLAVAPTCSPPPPPHPLIHRCRPSPHLLPHWHRSRYNLTLGEASPDCSDHTEPNPSERIYPAKKWTHFLQPRFSAAPPVFEILSLAIITDAPNRRAAGEEIHHVFC